MGQIANFCSRTIPARRSRSVRVGIVEIFHEVHVSWLRVPGVSAKANHAIAQILKQGTIIWQADAHSQANTPIAERASLLLDRIDERARDAATAIWRKNSQAPQVQRIGLALKYDAPRDFLIHHRHEPAALAHLQAEGLDGLVVRARGWVETPFVFRKRRMYYVEKSGNILLGSLLQKYIVHGYRFYRLANRRSMG